MRGGYYEPTAYLLAKLTLDASECGRQEGFGLEAAAVWH